MPPRSWMPSTSKTLPSATRHRIFPLRYCPGWLPGQLTDAYRRRAPAAGRLDGEPGRRAWGNRGERLRERADVVAAVVGVQGPKWVRSQTGLTVPGGT